MIQQCETNPRSSNAIADAINHLQAKPAIESLEKFMSTVGPQIDLNPKYQFIASQARVVLGIADQATYKFLFAYFENKNYIYTAMCCAEALLLAEEKSEVIHKHSELLDNYNNSKERELDLIRKTFIENPPDKTISIIMPTYNRHQYIRRAIKSVFNQTYQDFEIIVVNDGGSRECEAIIDSFYSDKIRYIYIEHGGLSHALNQGILISRGEYIAYLDDDDQYFPDHLQNLVSALQSSNSFVYTDAYREVKIYEDGNWTQKSKTVDYSYDFDAGSLAENNYIPILCMAHRRDCFEHIGLFEKDFPNAMDWDLWAKAARLYDFKHLKKVTCMYEYRLGPDSLSGRQLDNIFYSIILHKHHRYIAKQVWIDLSNKADQGLISYAEIESKTLRYQIQFVEWLLPLAFAEGKWHSALSLITKMTRNHPRKAFFTLRRLSPKITTLAQLFSFSIFFFISAVYMFKYCSRKGLSMFTLRGTN